VTKEPHAANRAGQDEETQRWVEQVRAGHPRHHQAVTRLHDLLLRVAVYELSRRRSQLGSMAGPELEELDWERLPDRLSPRPGDRLQQREQLEALSAAIGTLSACQREVFAAVALNQVPIDVLAIRLGSNRNAIYKNLFDARRTLRASLARAGHPVIEEDAVTP
jgi:RNA polymerase sigma-70 factor (ECF subfamily)